MHREPPRLVLAVGDDKLLTCDWLRERASGSVAARTEDADEVQNLADECGFPLIVKPRQGKGSYGITVIDNVDELQRVVWNAELLDTGISRVS